MAKKKEILLTSITLNPENPRTITEEDFETLVSNIKEFPQMLALRPIVVDSNNIIVGGNMRYRALLHLEYDKVPAEWIKKVDDFTEEQWKKFLVLDNADFGKWDYDQLANIGYEAYELLQMGVEVPKIKLDDGNEAGDNKKPMFNEYTLYFEDEDEQQVWFGFLRNLREQFPDQENISRRVLQYIADLYEDNGQLSDSKLILQFIKSAEHVQEEE